jgi:hypothetical protein
MSSVVEVCGKVEVVAVRGCGLGREDDFVGWPRPSME